MRDAAIDTSRSTARGGARAARAGGAPPLDDMVGERPIGRAAPRGGGITSAAIAAQRLGGGRAALRGKRGPGLAARLRSRVPRIKPLKVVTVAAFGVALVGIVANAMVFQRGHHPSPLFGFGRSVDGVTDPAGKTAAAVPPPAPPAPVEKTGTIPPPAPVEAPAPAVAADPAPAAPKPAPVHHAAKARHEEAAKPAEAPAHPRPGHPAAPHAKAEPKAEPKPDPVARLLAGAPHVAKPEAKAVAAPEHKAAPSAKLEARTSAGGKPSGHPEPKAADAAHPAKAGAEPASHPRHRLAAGAPTASKPAAEAE